MKTIFRTQSIRDPYGTFLYPNETLDSMRSMAVQGRLPRSDVMRLIKEDFRLAQNQLGKTFDQKEFRRYCKKHKDDPLFKYARGDFIDRMFDW